MSKKTNSKVLKKLKTNFKKLLAQATFNGASRIESKAKNKKGLKSQSEVEFVNIWAQGPNGSPNDPVHGSGRGDLNYPAQPPWIHFT